jgi:enoyl-CoA hydratase
VSDVLFERRAGLGLATLNRPAALNTMTLEMYRALDQRLRGWEADPALRLVLIRGAGDRAFCAGGDVRAVYQARGESGPSDYKAALFREEYVFLRMLRQMRRPSVVLADGITMGGGAGIWANASLRVGTGRTVFAMPEVFIGSIPDVGATQFLGRCPGRIGLYLALTGARIGAPDALYCGLATHFVPHDRLQELIEALAAGGAVLEELSRFSGDAGPPPLKTMRAEIDRCFGATSVEAVVEELRATPSDWARQALAAMDRASPLSLKLTFRQLQGGAQLRLEEALALEYRLMMHIMAGNDFFEGVRALLVDKDRTPKWQFASLAEVPGAEVDRYFEGLGDAELRF